ncbi:MAG: hypothetical protein EOP47_23575, partial [Sphingobacteriaceae bacterium]
MKQKFTLLVLVAGMIIFQGCKKTENAPAQITTTSGSDLITNSTGLRLDATETSGIFECLTVNGQSSGITNNSKAVGGTSEVADYAGTSFQKWKITKITGNYYTLKNLGSGLYAESYNYKGVQVLIQNKATGSDAQLWSLVNLSNKTYKAINKASGLAITTNGTGMIQLKAYTGASSQLWGYNRLPGSDTVKAAKFNIASILQSDMVIQRDKPFNVWGKTTPNFTVSVKVSWKPGLFTTVSDGSG